MLTHIRIRNFKQFEEVEFELGPSVVLIGPNNSGKTTALQALALWELGRDRWFAKRSGKDSPEKRPGVTINRRDLVALPVPHSKLLWRNLHIRNSERTNGKARTTNVRVDVIVKGITDEGEWTCGFEFDYSNDESFVCRPVRVDGFENARVANAEFTEIPQEAQDIRISFLPPMSGLAAEEPKWEPGRINVLIGEGQTAQILRNLCYQIYQSENGQWKDLCRHIANLFGVDLQPPDFIVTRGEITMQYKERGALLDISCSGRGLQQTVLLLAHLYTHPQSVLLLDEPDAHLEILRQRQIWRMLTEIAEQRGCQIIAASHSEVILNEAADKDMVIAFVGRPHRIDNRARQEVHKALRQIGFEHYYQAEETGWVLYLEGSTDLEILRALAKKLDHKASRHLERPFFYPVNSDTPQKAREHFYGLREAKPDLVGIAIFDRLDKQLRGPSGQLVETMWQRREIENYLCQRDVLLAYARERGSHYGEHHGDLFMRTEATKHERLMADAIDQVAAALADLDKPSPWSDDIRSSKDFLAPLFKKYYRSLELPNQMQKTNFHKLARFIEKQSIPDEITEKLDMIVEVAEKATPG